MSAAVRVTIEDLATGDQETTEIPPGEYLVIATDPCHVDHVQAHTNGTHVVTIRGRTP